MESTHETPHQFSSGTGNTPPSRDLGSAADKAGKSARAAGEQFSDVASEKLGQAKQMVGDVYDQMNRTVSDTYNQAVDYGRENPGKTTLIAFGVGVGVGLLMMGNIRRSHRPSRRVVQPVVNALSNLACDLFA